MALQGDLDSFAIPDVLRLLAGTQKSGRLEVTGDPDSGELWLLEGDVVGGSATSRPSAKSPAEVVYELLSFQRGAFVFDDGDQLVDGGERSSVDDALSAAAELEVQWNEVTQVVPSLDHWVTFAPDLEGDEVTVTADDWRLLASVAAGASVRGIGAHLEVSDLDASKRVRSLVESGLVTIAEAPDGAVSSLGTRAEPVETGGYDDFNPDDLFDDPSSRLADDHELVTLSAEDGPVVLETSEDALLPEPLPGEGTAYSADVSEHGSVDARTFDTPAAEEPEADPVEPHSGGDDAAAELIDLDQPIDFGIEIDRGTDATDGPKSAFAAGWESDDKSDIGRSEEAFAAVGWDDTPPVDHLGGDDSKASDEPAESEGDRSSLLKFLSSVKP